MPTSNTSNTSSPVKRPGLGRRAVSSHAVVTRANTSDLSEIQKAAAHHKPHRAHVVHRNHHRNPSTNKNFNKLQRFQLGPETTGRHHQRKKSAPATPIASPKEGGHIRWDNAVGDHQTDPSMKRNYSTPVLRRNPSAVGKKALVTERPTSSGVKKTVGFELGDDETDEAEWEDTTQSPESTRRNSVAPSNPSAENSTVLVDHLTFVKRPYPQMPRATSLPESVTHKFARERAEQVEDEDDKDEEDQDTADEAEQSSQHTEQGDIASRLLSPSHSSKAPPAMSSISAMVKPETKHTNPASRSSASLNLAAGQDNARRTFSSASMASIPGSHPQATSSSMEGGVSRFILNNKNSMQASSRTDSDPNTPSSFLPHYHPQTPPSPKSGAGKSTASSARPRGAELPSRTQQKLWLQRTATLNNSPPDTHGVATVASPAIDPSFITANQRPTTGAYDAGRGLNGDSRVGVTGHDSETRHIRKAYEKTSLELMVVRRFQSPTAQSFSRLRHIAQARKALQGPGLGKQVKSAPSLPLLQHGKRPNQLSSSPTTKPQSRSPIPTDDPTNSDPTTPSGTMNPSKSNDPSHRILSTSDEASRDPSGENQEEEFPANDSAMLIRRMWESREVAIHG
ncbi:unnamed protein product [Penicillium salamii]|uniref:Uncharacterized protein n=1 Tax=Penicillium salamii TaxID=1612424 RepID=A0A9W4J223_9EURO|nr:unnamed protein product [Penicillium salamii]CAG8315902.1 unnamed protein product [Penicillium salamii]CAG8342951.1 unnamed protein product [Penicillium salamii]CAG8364809.1 unnamed protein product [Penicillium salamii]CAG8374457.1 unnamed protein product [Penicillium salamii]